MTHNSRNGANAYQGTDPVLAAIEQHRRAQAALNDAAGTLDDLKADLPHDVRRAPGVCAGAVRSRNGSAKPTWLHSTAEIDHYLARWRGVYPDHVLTAKAIELRAALAADAAALADAQMRAGLTAAQEAYDQACAAEDRALQRLTRTVPTTAAGASALARYIVSHLDKTEGSPARDEINVATLATLERALTSLAQVA